MTDYDAFSGLSPIRARARKEEQGLSDMKRHASCGSNRLPELASQIRRAHADVQEAAKTAAERAIEAGHALLEAKQLVKHGEWLPWLREHCAVAERTSQLYMQLARKGVKPAIVADLGLQAAANSIEAEYGFFRPMYDGEEPARWDWNLFAVFLALNAGMRVENAVIHTDWLGRQNFSTPEEWLGPDGQAFVRSWGRTSSDAPLHAWLAFKEERKSATLAEIEAELERLSEADEDRPVAKKRRRRKCATL